MSANRDITVAETAPSSGDTNSSLPQDLLEQSCKRVGMVGLVGIGLWGYAIANALIRPIAGVVQTAGITAAFPMPGNVIAGVGVIASLVLVVAARSLHHKPILLSNIGLAYLVLSAAFIGLLNQWHPQLIPGNVSWICIILLVYPAIAPNTVRKTLVVSLIAASMDPAALGLTLLRVGEIQATLAEALQSFLPNYVCAALAVVPAHIIARLGRQVSKAKALGSYQLGEVLGQGGMGEVHLATHRMLARPAAIKMIRAEVLGASSTGAAKVIRERFRREAQAAAALRSPHTIELYDFGVNDNGTFYYVMELLDGLDLEALVERFGPVPAERAVHFLQHACLSLGEAHAGGMIHRDVKPSNLHATRLGLTVDFVKILDFGLVKNIGPQPDSTLTAPQVAPGTPTYMAPEIAMGEKPDQRADIYSLGCVAFWLLTGQLVFGGRNPAEIMNKHVQDDPTPPSKCTELEIPPALDELVLACLAKQRDLRPANGEELGRLLGAIELEQEWSQERARRWWDTHVPNRSYGEVSHHGVLEPAGLSLD
jgi:tRNA A-37 threonylcarbamoyl transferase component Bud32